MMSIGQYIRRFFRFVIFGEPKKYIKAEITYLAPNNRLRGKNIIVTGGGRGLGYAMAKKFVEEGANVLIAGRNYEVLKKSADELNCKYLEVDVCDVESLTLFIQKAEDILGEINCLVNNAGVSLHEHGFLDVSLESFNTQIDTNLRSGVFLSQSFINYVQNRNLKGGDILFVSSEVGDLADNRPYGWTKVAINSLVRGLASNYAINGIRVNAISPGITCSNMTGFREDGNLYVRTNATQRAYLPGEVSEIACFLLSDCSSCLSGQVIVCNNGKTIYTREKVEKNG